MMVERGLKRSPRAQAMIPRMNQNPYAPPVDVSLLDGSAAAGVEVVAWDEQPQVGALLMRSLVFCYRRVICTSCLR
jgi:hypothetical protein